MVRDKSIAVISTEAAFISFLYWEFCDVSIIAESMIGIIIVSVLIVFASVFSVLSFFE